MPVIRIRPIDLDTGVLFVDQSHTNAHNLALSDAYQTTAPLQTVVGSSLSTLNVTVLVDGGLLESYANDHVVVHEIPLSLHCPLCRVGCRVTALLYNITLYPKVVSAPITFASTTYLLPNIIATRSAPGAARYKPIPTSAAPKNLFATVTGTLLSLIHI